jgi:3-methyladenine DNA glycosylase AlkD
MTIKEIMQQLQEFGDENTKKTLMKHGAKEPFFGVKVADLKKILKKTKKNHELSLELYATGNSDAMYLAGLMADEKQITRVQLEQWMDKAYWHYLSEYTVPWVVAETTFGFEMGLEWIDSKDELRAAAGWNVLAYYAGVNPDENLDIAKYFTLLEQIGKEIHSKQNRVRYTMNGFVIAIGTYITQLTEKSKEIATQIGKVEVEMGGTACKVPLATDYIQKVVDKGRVGKKRKTARC